MTIKEVEARTGMTRANIRFYETEGLIAPARSENGYRDYSEEDVALLLRVKLLRLLEMPLEEIKRLGQGEGDLPEVLDGHIRRLEEQQERLADSRQVCRAMCRDGVQFATLDPAPYLERLEGTKRRLDGDVLPRVQAPWRRFLPECWTGPFISCFGRCCVRRFSCRTGRRELWPPSRPARC